MSNEKDNRKVSKIQDNPGLFDGMSRTLRLVLRLLADSRVNFFLKLLPIGSLIYLFSPLDAAIPFIDDAVIVGLGTYAFIELCPPEVVEEHQAKLAGRDTSHTSPDDDSEVIDTSFTEIDPK
jgi:hypothetical protein